MQSKGIKISLPNINESTYSFKPKEETNEILYGIKGISKIGSDIVNNIILNRPYSSWEDFLKKVKVNKTQMVNLIKSGAFDCFGDRQQIMYEYILSVSDQKKRLTLQNMQMLIKYDLLPQELNQEIKVFNFNKYLKKNKSGDYYLLDSIAFAFYEKNYDIDILTFKEDKTYILQKDWDKIYKKEMDTVRDYLKKHNKEILDNLNDTLFKETYSKYAEGTISKWEMDSLSFYYHEHELAHIQKEEYGLVNFFKLPEEPQVDRIIYIKNKEVPLYKLSRIAGTVLDKDKNKNTITLLTPDGVVKVKIYRPQFSKYDKQLSMKLADGTKKVVEKSWFTRGNKLMIYGIRRGQDFVPKIYKNNGISTPFFLINEIDENGYITGVSERTEV